MMLFSQKQKTEVQSIYPYENLPKKFRLQVFHLIKKMYSVSNGSTPQSRDYFRKFVSTICEEHGIYSLTSAPGCTSRPADPVALCLHFIVECTEDDWVVDMIELIFIDMMNSYYYNYPRINDASKNCYVETLNRRFRENGIGLEFINNQIIKVDSMILHHEAVKPALLLLHDPRFEGALDEYLEAHEHYKNGNNDEAITSVAKSFESTMKTICILKGWKMEKQTAAPLIKTLFDNGLLPSYYMTQLNSLKTTLEGLATIRNKNTAHGQGMDLIHIPDYLTQYALNLAGSNITFLIKVFEENTD
ncbi:MULTISPECIES: STM4504/CBY_0614 family protein [Exiguobacterium]|nr:MULTISPECIES: hypothetical protein [Exiguobacterium]